MERCPWCSQPTEHEDLKAELRREAAADLEQMATHTWVPGGPDGAWFNRGLQYAAMLLRHGGIQ